MRPSVRTSSVPVSAAHLAATHPTSTNAERIRRRPGIRGRVSRAKLKKSCSAPAGERASVDAPPRRMPGAVRGLARLDERRVAGAREVNVGPASLVVVVEPGDVRLDAVHRRHLEGRRGRRNPHRHREEPVPVAVDEAPEDRHVPAGQRLVEDGAREPVDLDDQEAPPAGHGRGAQPETPDDPVDRRLGAEKEVVDESFGERPGARPVIGRSSPTSICGAGSRDDRWRGPRRPGARGPAGLVGLGQGQEGLRESGCRRPVGRPRRAAR